MFWKSRVQNLRVSHATMLNATQTPIPKSAGPVTLRQGR